mmetsp:Transcript_106001/g.295896  ORF Transcript_106001/g.295896 Transcript_106001/m.295896 type:complete len:223 (+) Transcript_106001:220-888(+)
MTSSSSVSASMATFFSVSESRSMPISWNHFASSHRSIVPLLSLSMAMNLRRNAASLKLPVAEAPSLASFCMRLCHLMLISRSCCISTCSSAPLPSSSNIAMILSSRCSSTGRPYFCISVFRSSEATMEGPRLPRPRRKASATLARIVRRTRVRRPPASASGTGSARLAMTHSASSRSWASASPRSPLDSLPTDATIFSTVCLSTCTSAFWNILQRPTGPIEP